VNFDGVAPHYRWLETLIFGQRLQEARVAFVRQIRSPRRVLIVGEGNGRFLAEFVRVHPEAEVDCIEASAGMIALAREGGSERTRFIEARLEEVELEAGAYDLIVTHFFLDCFGESTLPGVIEKLSRAAAGNASWLIADFHEPARGWRRRRARFLVATMYLFFRFAAGIEARCLVECGPFLRAQGFVLQETVASPDEAIQSQLWERATRAAARSESPAN